MGAYPTTSHSRIESFQKCSAFYNYKYRQRISYPEEFNRYFFLGTIVHELIENKLVNGQDVQVTFEALLGGYLDKLNVYLEISPELLQLLRQMAYILYRCSARCREDDEPIRTNSGNVLKDPIKYPSSSFKKAVSDANLWPSIIFYDNQICMQNSSLNRENVLWLLAEALELSLGFSLPKWITNTVAAELPLSTNKENLVKLGQTSVYFNGYIDWVAEIGDDLAIIDHKTGSTKPTGPEVLFHTQLNLYAWAYEQVYGRRAKYIGINHIRSGEIVLAEVDLVVRKSIVDYIIETQGIIEVEQTPKRHTPMQYNTPCYKKDYKSGQLAEVCPYLDLCWPTYREVLNELAENERI
jgi:CRISPR/Cas system-associated exonuclease Cas4 (RecB family)